MLGRVSIDAVGKGVKIFAETRRLLLVPTRSASGHAHRTHPLVRLKIILPPVFGSPAARLSVETKNEIAMTVHLCFAESIECGCIVVGEDMRHAPRIPQNLRCLLRRNNACATGSMKNNEQNDGQSTFHDLPT